MNMSDNFLKAYESTVMSPDFPSRHSIQSIGLSQKIITLSVNVIILKRTVIVNAPIRKKILKRYSC